MSKRLPSDPAGTAFRRRVPIRAQLSQHERFYDDPSSAASRQADYERLITNYYDLVTDFYEAGWGESFHFAPRRRGERFRASLARHQRFLAESLGLRPGMEVLDAGCGIGGPMRAIARASGAIITGLNINAYQIRRAWILNEKAGLSRSCRVVNGDFMALGFAENSFDAAYAIEATCHAPERIQAFREIGRVLKPGALFAGYEWCLTARFDPLEREHLAIKKRIEQGNGLPDLTEASAVTSALRAAGFETTEAKDLAETTGSDAAWYTPLAEHGLSLRGFLRTRAGRGLTNRCLRFAERFGCVPSGMAAVSSLLNEAADALVQGGQRGIFTPMFYFLARKPDGNTE